MFSIQNSIPKRNQLSASSRRKRISPSEATQRLVALEEAKLAEMQNQNALLNGIINTLVIATKSYIHINRQSFADCNIRAFTLDMAGNAFFTQRTNDYYIVGNAKCTTILCN